LVSQGDEKAFTALFNLLGRALASYAYRILNNTDQAKEVVHITFCKVWDNRKKIKIEESVKAYFYKAVYNNCLSKLREKKQFRNFIDLELAELYFNRIIQNPYEELRLLDSEMGSYISKAIEELPPRCREIFVKCKIEGGTYKDVAQSLNISEKSVETQISIALKRLREKLDWLLILFIV